MEYIFLVNSLTKKLPKESKELIITEIEKLNESQKSSVLSKLSTLHLKNPSLVFWIGNFLLGSFGIARFMIGDIKLGLIRLILAFTSILIFSMADEGSIDKGSFFAIVGGVIYILNSWVWYIIDLFLVGKKLRKQNLEKVLNVLNKYKENQ